QYLQWSVADPVSWKERVRNAAIYEYQHNRNPFVDHPEFVSAIYDSSNVTAGGEPESPARAVRLTPGPKPFPSATPIAYGLPRRGAVAFRISDMGGRRVRTLIPGEVQGAGRHAIDWDGRNDSGAALESGLYFGRLDSAGQSDVTRLLRIR